MKNDLCESKCEYTDELQILMSCEGGKIMMRIARALLINLVIIIVISSLVNAETTISFDEPPGTIPVATRYSDKGVLLPLQARIISLPLPYTESTSKARSGTNVLLSRDLGNEFDQWPLIIQFTHKVQWVKLYTGVTEDTGGNPVHVTLKAFNESGNLVDEMELDINGYSDITTEMSVKAPSGQHIRKVDLEYERAFFEFVDDLTFSSQEEPPPPPPSPPVVSITSPSHKLSVDGKIQISGTISGEGLVPKLIPPTLAVWFYTEPNLSTNWILSLGRNLQWSSSTPPYLTFSFPFELTSLGENKIRVEAINPAGTGSDEISITYFPEDITREYTKKGGLNTFGGFLRGSGVGDCSYARYHLGVIFSTPTGIYSVLGDIFKKWKEHNFLGCAKGPEKFVGGKFQDFEGGRVYTGPEGAFFVTEPFVDAIDKLDFVENYGLPVTDTVRQSKELVPILWQKFKRTFEGIFFSSTMEVTEDYDSSLKLWVATPDIEGSKRAGAPITLRIPTLWRSFSCDERDEPCIDVGKTQPTQEKTSYSNLVNACDDGHYPYFGVPAWSSLATKKIVPFTGIVSSLGISKEDAPGNHYCSGALNFTGVDYTMKLLPEPGNEHLLGEKQEALEIEYEHCLVGYPHPDVPVDIPKPGDKMFVAGRWIADCGCHPFPFCGDPYRSEIHPPAVMINMYTTTTDPFGELETKGEILYFDWWYPGEVVEVDIYPPPRPEPDAILSYTSPIWPTFCTSDDGECGIQISVNPTSSMNHLHLKISGRPDVPFYTPPIEDWDGQLWHGRTASRYTVGRLVVTDPVWIESWLHKISLLGYFDVYWRTRP